jgi:hypothetical protein
LNVSSLLASPWSDPVTAAGVPPTTAHPGGGCGGSAWAAPTGPIAASPATATSVSANRLTSMPPFGFVRGMQLLEETRTGDRDISQGRQPVENPQIARFCGQHAIFCSCLQALDRRSPLLLVRSWLRESGCPDCAGARARLGRLDAPRGTRPTSPRVQQVLGSWSAGLEAAGLEPRPRYGQPAELCRNGHEFAVEGYTSPDGGRHCRACIRERKRRQRARRAARRAYMRRLRARQHAEGLCTRCGTAPAAPDRACCAGCLAYLRAADARRRAERAA